MKSIVSICVLTMTWIGAGPRAEADPLRLSPAQVLDVNFVLPDTLFPFGTPNTLVFTIDITRIAPFGLFSATLFDNGERLVHFPAVLTARRHPEGLASVRSSSLKRALGTRQGTR